jgi:hypothetical protein
VFSELNFCLKGSHIELLEDIHRNVTTVDPTERTFGKVFPAVSSDIAEALECAYEARWQVSTLKVTAD